jgi:trigger factor
LKANKGIEVEKKVSVVTAEEVDAEIGRQREQNARVIAVEGRALQTAILR